MQRKTLVAELAETLLRDIVAGTYPARSLLPSEPQLAATHQVSRLTVREAVNTLRAGNIVEVQRGRGTFVNPPELWSDIEALGHAYARQLPAAELARHLMEVRRTVEARAAELAARQCSAAALAPLDAAIQALTQADAQGDVAAAAQADLAFHDAVLAASGNPFYPLLYTQLRHILALTRGQTSASATVRQRALDHHHRIRQAIAAGDPVAARRVMAAHMDQTWDDYAQLLQPATTPGAPGDAVPTTLAADLAQPITTTDRN